NSKSLADFGSEGQMRLAAYALKLAEWHLMKEKSQDLPLMLIDDFAAFLDREKREKLFALTSSLGQTFFTTHEPEQCSTERKTFRIDSGLILSK
ncbi:MAG TPA: hypothetical protein VN457_01380, partial [Chlamydiales bacterium]|nr:hypothetical protein [Chlamydiales bacterium]